MTQETYEDVSRLSQYRDLLQHPGYKALLGDLGEVQKVIMGKLFNSHEDGQSLRLLRELQTFNKIYQVLSQIPQECGARLESILGDETEVTKGIH